MDIGEGYYPLILKCGIWDYNPFIDGRGKLKAKRLKEKGIALVLGMLLLLVLTFIGISVLNSSIYDILISGNERASIQAFYVAEAGINEFIGRFRANATNQILDNDPSNPDWKVLLAKYPGKGATQIGFISGDPNSIPSLQNQLDFGLEVKHKIDAVGNVIKYNGRPIYIAKSYGYTSDGGNKAIEVEIKIPLLDPPAALYAESPANIKGNSTYIQGNDQCGTDHKPGILTTLLSTDPNAVDTSGGPTISGTPNIKYSGEDLNLQEAVNYFKKDANFSYNYTGNATETGLSWGVPTYPPGTPVAQQTQTPLTYTGNPNIVYFNMQGNKTIKLAGGTTGAGILIVDGNLELNGGVTWYGIIIVTGALDFTGDGEKNVTGGILAGESATIEIDVAGNAGITGIIYCSSVANWLKNGLSPFIITRWREIF